MVDASALGAEEGRGKRRNAPGSRKRAKIRRSPNGGNPLEVILEYPLMNT